MNKWKSLLFVSNENFNIIKIQILVLSKFICVIDSTKAFMGFSKQLIKFLLKHKTEKSKQK
jgi:hypothetical protein